PGGRIRYESHRTVAQRRVDSVVVVTPRRLDVACGRTGGDEPGRVARGLREALIAPEHVVEVRRVRLVKRARQLLADVSVPNPPAAVTRVVGVSRTSIGTDDDF